MLSLFGLQKIRAPDKILQSVLSMHPIVRGEMHDRPGYGHLEELKIGEDDVQSYRRITEPHPMIFHYVIWRQGTT